MQKHCDRGPVRDIATQTALYIYIYIYIYIYTYMGGEGLGGGGGGGGKRARRREETTNLLEELFEDGERSLPLLHVLSEVFQSDARPVAPEVGLQTLLDHRHALVHQVEQRAVVCEMV